MRNTRRQRWISVLGAGALLIAGVQAVTAAPAAAATIPSGSVQVISVASGFSVSASKTVTATCPSTRPRVLGGGFTTAGTHIEVTELRPIAGTVDSYRVTAVQDEVGTTASWQILAYAYCSSVAPGHQIVTTASTVTSDPFNSTTPTCPSGKAVTGSGGQINGGAGQVKLLTQGEGSAAPNRITAAGLEDLTGFSGNWNVVGYAVCVTYTSVFDIQVVRNQSANDTVSPKNTTAACPSGKRATGGAGWIDSPGTIISVVPNTSTPINSRTIGRNEVGSSFSWTVFATVFCAS